MRSLRRVRQVFEAGEPIRETTTPHLPAFPKASFSGRMGTPAAKSCRSSLLVDAACTLAEHLPAC